MIKEDESNSYKSVSRDFISLYFHIKIVYTLDNLFYTFNIKKLN